MKEMGEQIVAYWQNRAEGYSEYNREELAGDKWQEWLRQITKYLDDLMRKTKKKKSEVRVLDIGTGPGFFAILLAREGYDVTAIDCTEEMLREARKNAGGLAECIHWQVMDAQQLNLADQNFDLVLSRNLTWVLEEPERAYAEWFRVLRPGGILLNFDANWYRYLYDEEMRKGYEADRAATLEQQVRDEYVNTDIDAMETIARAVPLSRTVRPAWDEKVLHSVGFSDIQIDTQIWEKLWTEDEKTNFASTPLFRIAAVR